MKNDQQFKLTFLFLFLCFSCLNINAQNSSYTTTVNVILFPGVESLSNVEIYINGQLATNVIETGVNYKVITEDFPAKVELKYKGDVLNGINVGSIIKISNHILAKTAFNSPYQMLAADINNDGKVSISDVMQIRKLILGKTDEFTPDRSWMFIDNESNLTMANWTEVQEGVKFLPNDELIANFRAIKLGRI